MCAAVGLVWVGAAARVTVLTPGNVERQISGRELALEASFSGVRMQDGDLRTDWDPLAAFSTNGIPTERVKPACPT